MSKEKLKEDVMIAARASSVDELQRLLHLAGVGQDGGCDQAAEAPVVHFVQPHQTAFETIQEDIDEGWLDREAPPGVERYKVGDPDDTIDVDFRDETIADQDEEEDIEEAGEPSGYDYGHDQGIMQRMDTSGLDRTPRGRSAVRYTPARHADNPLMDDDANLKDEEEGEYNQAVNDTAKKAPRGGSDNYVGRESKRLAAKFGLKPEDVDREIRDQMVLYNKGPVRERIEESIGVLVEDDSDELASALRKIRHRLYENLSETESAHLAAAFINLMRNSDSAQVAHVHQMFQNYIGSADVERAYEEFRKQKQ